MPSPRGPAPTPTHLRLLRGNPSKRPMRPEPQPTVPAEVPEAPGYLVGHACDEWYRISGELFRLGLLTILDIHVLAAYRQAYARWRAAEEALAKMAERDPGTRGLLVRDFAGNAKRNPLAKIATDAADAMVTF